MSQTIKTLIFMGVALVVALVALFTYPKQESFKAPSLVGQPLFKDFTDPGTAATLKIARFSEDLGELTEFEVTRDNQSGLWTIPSSSGYPADAETQMRDAATGLIDLQVIGIASERAADHEIYGVVEPDKETLEASQAGVGLLVSVSDAKGMELAELIIGKQVKGTEEQRFVRVPNQNPVYVVNIDPAKYPTDFEKWIERDLLQLNSFDVENVELKDYSMLTNRGLDGLPRLEKFDERFDATVTFNSSEGKWELKKLVEFPGGQAREVKLLDSEELNSQKLNDLKTALDDLKIVGVVRKPAGLGGDLKAGNEFMEDNESLLSLMDRGFFPVAIAGGPRELRAANGEVQVTMKDGVKYVLRFGEIAGAQNGTEEGKLNRYLFVSAMVDPDKFPPLALEPLPETEADLQPGDAESDTAEAETSEPTADETADADTSGADETDDSPEEESVEQKSKLELERARITKENARKQEERDEQLKKAGQKVDELNARFADWYYIISEDEYKKIHLGRNDLIKESESAEDEGFGVDALRKMEEEGVEGSSDTDDAGASTGPAGLPNLPQ